MLSFSFLSTALLALGPLSAHAIPTPRNHRQQNEVQSQEIPAGCGGGDLSQSSPSVATTAAVVSSSVVSSSIAVVTSSASSVKSVSTAATSSAAISSSAVASSSVASTAVAAAASSTSTASLNSLAVAAGKKYFGSATDNPELTDTDYVAILSDSSMFGQITPGNSWKWDATEATQGVFTFTNADAIATLAEDNGQLLRGHNCVWYSQLPSWVSGGGFSADELSDVMTTHCTTLLDHFKGQTYAFDIVNEPFNEDGTFRSDVFFDTLGSSYVSTVLTAARTADPSTKLYINEYNIEYAGAKATAMASLVSNLTSASVPIDGVGMQAHFIVGSVPTDLKTQIQTFADLGVEVAITELDIRMTLPATDELLAQQKTDYENVVAACMDVDGCVGITIWDYTDKYSWVPSTFSGSGAACPWDENLVTKPAFDGIVAALSA